MKISRDWFTPLTMGSFFLLSVTGVLMFFHLESGMNKLAHQWLSWLLLAAVITHVVSNGAAFKRHWTVRRTQWIFLAMAILTALTFLPGPAKNPNPQKLAVKTLESARLSQVADLKGHSLQEMQGHLRKQGIVVPDQDLTLKDISKETGIDLQTVLSKSLSMH
jgi:Domain of unknown function (DUF4405)